MTYKPLIFDEEEIGKEVYERGKVEDYGKRDLVALSKYLRYNIGYGDARVKKNLIEILSRNETFNYDRMRSYLGTILSESKKEYIRTGSVKITLSELKVVRSLKNFRWQKILLGLLFLSKRENNKGYVKVKEWSDVKSLFSSGKIVSSEIEHVAYLLYQEGDKIVPTANEKFGASHKILFIDNNSEIIFDIDTERMARNLPSLYKDWCGGELYWCRDCHNEFVRNGHTHYYCSICSKKREILRHRKYNKKRISHNDVLTVD